MENGYLVPTVRLDEHADGFDVKFVIPGVAKEEVGLDVQGRTLVLKTQAKRQNPAGFRQVVSEFVQSDYAVSVDLPETADPATLKAALANGVLTVTVAKRPEGQARKIEIG